MKLNGITHSWEDLIRERINNDNFKSCTCKIYNQQSWVPNNSNELCSCGRLVRRHSFNGECIQAKSKSRENVIWTPPNDYRVVDHSTKVPVDVYGSLKPTGCKFLRIDKRSKPEVIYKLLVDDCGGEAFKPSLILSVLGGAKYFTMTERLEKEVIQGIIDTANAVDAWILTIGVNTGVSKLVGEGMLHHHLLKDTPNKIKCIGLTKWGTITEDMRFELKKATEHYSEQLLNRQNPETVQEDKETIETNHTHCILFDDGNLNGYLDDTPRNELVTEACKPENYPCFGVTIIVEGGLGSLGSIENDISKKRPIVLIQGSGRLADVLATLIEQTSNCEQNRQRIPTEEEIKKTIKQFFHNLSNSDILETTKRIQKILKEKHRHLLHVFSLDRGDNMSETIFKTIFTMTRTTNEMNNDNNQEQQSQSTEDKLVDLALRWNYIDGALPIFKSRDQEKNIERNSDLFYESLIRNRPTFVQYFLVAGFDPLILFGRKKKSNSPVTISDVYEDSYSQMTESHQNCIKALFDEPSNETVKLLDYKLNKFVGTFIKSIYSSQNENYTKRVYIDMINHVCTCCKCKMSSNEKSSNQNSANNNMETVSPKDKLLRDLFLWSVFMDMPEMTKTFLLHLQPRICAALIASAIFKRYAKTSTTIDHKEKFHKQALEFETCAATFINKCYQYNERLACELLLREIPLFGNITCMQIAISNGSGKFVGTSCFHQTLSYVWYNKLSTVNRHLNKKPAQFSSILSFGLLAPLILSYSEKEESREDEPLSSDGINYYMDKELSKNMSCRKYWNRFLYFHESPMIKVFCHFISYIGFLLVFSYMMLYHFDSPDTFKIPNWSEIYVIITVSTMLCEEVRKSYHDYKTRMTERWSSPGTALLTIFTYTFYILPYFLFYLGLAFRYRAYNDDILKTARIIWAFDLELWYLGSLKFIIVLKSVGPKLFMLKNMLKDLAGFVYMIFIAIAAYGVVSRSLILYKQVPFTLTGILKEILYEPYWFIYGVVSDKDLLDQKTNNDTGPFVAEAAATHFLLAFHMLFINILILNLLIAVFTHTIDEVQENTDFHWRYQRYSFVREYFERPVFAYPPLIIFPYIVLLFLALGRECRLKLHRNQVNKGPTTKSTSSTPSFKMILKNSNPKYNRWDMFENASTHSYARSILEQNKKKNVLTTNDNYSKSTMNTNESNVIETTSDYQQIISNLNKEIVNIKAVVNENQKCITELHSHIKNHEQQIWKSLEWIMKAMARVKMNNSNELQPTLNSSFTDDNVLPSSQTITSFNQ